MCSLGTSTICAVFPAIALAPALGLIAQGFYFTIALLFWNDAVLLIHTELNRYERL
jgi:hypothetical protein